MEPARVFEVTRQPANITRFRNSTMDNHEFPFTRQIKLILLRVSSWPVVHAFNHFVLVIFGVCMCTYIFTSCRFYLSSKKNREFRGNEPPTLAYWLPWVGNGIQMIRDPHKFYEETLYVCSCGLYVDYMAIMLIDVTVTKVPKDQQKDRLPCV